jgi:hypothetical protein
MVPQIKHPAILRLYFETKIIRFPPGFEDGTDLDPALLQEKRGGSFICPET